MHTCIVNITLFSFYFSCKVIILILVIIKKLFFIMTVRYDHVKIKSNVLFVHTNLLCDKVGQYS